MAIKKTTKLGSLLRRARNDAGYSQRDVEEEKGVSNAYLSQIESGKIQEPSPTILHKLAELYEIDYGELLELAGYPVPQFGKKKKSAFRSSKSTRAIKQRRRRRTGGIFIVFAFEGAK